MKFKILAFLLFVCQMASQDKANPGTGADRTSVVSKYQLDGWVAKWQKRLALPEWDIRARIVRKDELKGNLVATITWNSSKKTAILKVLDSRDSALAPQAYMRDTELSVVHELTHLSLYQLPLSSVKDTLEEEAVNRISRALLELEEEKKSKVLLTSR